MVIVGPEVPDQRTLRPPEPVRDLDEFLAFLDQLDDVLPPVDRPFRPTTGERFLL
jgi:hypothetical protein